MITKEVVPDTDGRVSDQGHKTEPPVDVPAPPAAVCPEPKDHNQHVLDRAYWFFVLGYHQGKFELDTGLSTKGIDMTTVRDLSNLGDQLKRSVAINGLEQAIMKLDVTIEGMQRTMDALKEIKFKLETYERKD